MRVLVFRERTNENSPKLPRLKQRITCRDYQLLLVTAGKGMYCRSMSTLDVVLSSALSRMWGLYCASFYGQLETSRHSLLVAACQGKQKPHTHTLTHMHTHRHTVHSVKRTEHPHFLGNVCMYIIYILYRMFFPPIYIFLIIIFFFLQAWLVTTATRAVPQRWKRRCTCTSLVFTIAPVRSDERE